MSACDLNSTPIKHRPFTRTEEKCAIIDCTYKTVQVITTGDVSGNQVVGIYDGETLLPADTELFTCQAPIPTIPACVTSVELEPVPFTIEGENCDGEVVEVTGVPGQLTSVVQATGTVFNVKICNNKDYERDIYCDKTTGAKIFVITTFEPLVTTYIDVLSGLPYTGTADDLEQCASGNKDFEYRALEGCRGDVALAGFAAFDTATNTVVGEVWRDPLTGLWGALPDGATVGACASNLPVVDCTIQGEKTEVIDEENSIIYFTQQEFTNASGDGWTFNFGAASNFATFAGGQAFSLIDTLPAVAITQSVPSGSYLRIYATGTFSSVFAFVNGNPTQLTQVLNVDPAYKLYQYPASNAGDTIRFQFTVANSAQTMTLDRVQIVNLVTKIIPGEITITKSVSVKLDDCTKAYLDELLSPRSEYTRQPISWCESDGGDPPLYTRYEGTQIRKWDGANVVDTVYIDATNMLMIEPFGWRYV